MKPTNISHSVKTKCFVYLRRSQDREDRQMLSIEKQDRRVREIVKDNDLMPIFLPSEDRSARKPGRPLFNDMLERVRSGEARYIAVWSLSRLSRNPIDCGEIVYLLDEGKLLGIFTPTRIYRNTPDDKAFLAIELAFSKKENDELSERVIDSFIEKRGHGEYPGPAFIGYVNAIVGPGRRNIVQDPERSPMVIRMFEMAATGLYSLQELWKEAHDMGLVSRKGRRLAKQTISEMLHRRAYTGVFQYGGGEWHQGTYQPLITVELFNKVQAAMGWVKSSTDRAATTSGRHYLYKGLLLCKTCSFNVTAYTKAKQLAGGESAEYVFYTCTKKSKQVKCKEPQLSAPLIEQEIKSLMQEYEISEDDGTECIRWIERYYSDYVSKKNQYKPQWLRDSKEAQHALEVLDEKLERGVITDERYQIRAAIHEELLARTAELLSSANTDAERWLELARETFSSLINIGEVFDIATDDERKQLMTYLGSNWYLGNKKVTLTVRKPLHLLHKSNRNLDWRAVALQVWNYFLSEQGKMTSQANT